MFPLKKHQAAQPAAVGLESHQGPSALIAVESPYLTDYAAQLKEKFGVQVVRQQLGSGLAVQAVKDLGTGLETQQLDNSRDEAAMDRIKETIIDFDNKHPHTGPTHVYLLDGRGMGTADDGVINGLIAASLRNPGTTLAALIPEDSRISSPNQLSPSSMLKQLADNVLASEGVRCVIGKHALEAFLKGDEQYVVYGEASAPSLEAQLDAVAVGGIALIGAAIYGVYRLIKNARKNAREKEERIAQLQKAIHQLRLRLGQVSKGIPELKQGTVASKDFGQYLTIHGHVPENIGHAAVTYGHALSKFVEEYGHAVSAYIDEVATAIQSVSEKHAARGGTTGSIQFGSNINLKYSNGQSTPESDLAMAIQGIKDPGERVHFPQELALGGISWDDCKKGDWHRHTDNGVAELPAMSAQEYKASAEGINTLLNAFDVATHASDRISASIARHERSWAAFKGIHQKWDVTEEKVKYEHSDAYQTITHRELENESAWDAVEDLLGSSRVLDYDPSHRLYNLAMWTARSVEGIGKWMDRSTVQGEPGNV